METGGRVAVSLKLDTRVFAVGQGRIPIMGSVQNLTDSTWVRGCKLSLIANVRVMAQEGRQKSVSHVLCERIDPVSIDKGELDVKRFSHKFPIPNDATITIASNFISVDYALKAAFYVSGNYFDMPEIPIAFGNNVIETTFGSGGNVRLNIIASNRSGSGLLAPSLEDLPSCSREIEFAIGQVSHPVEFDEPPPPYTEQTDQ